MLPVWAVISSFVAAVALAVGVDAWVRHQGQGKSVRWFRVTLYCGVAWSLGSVLQSLADGKLLKIAMLQIWSVPSWALPFVWFVFVLYYTGFDHYLTREVTVALGSAFAILAGLSLTNHLHGLIWTDLSLNSTVASSPVLVAIQGPLYQAGLLVSYLLVGISLLLLVRLFLTARRVSRSQVAAIGLGVMFPVVLNLISVESEHYAPALNLSPVGFDVFLVLVGWALFRYQLFGIEPQARAEILEVIDEGVLVVDDTGLVVDYNDRATRLFPGLREAIGEPVSESVPVLVADGSDSDHLTFEDAVAVETDAGRRSLNISVSDLVVAGERRAAVVVCQDVTELEAYARELEQRTEQLDRFAETVSHDLRNPISVIKGRLKLIEETGDTSHVRQANEATERMTTIIENVLTLARQGHAVEDPDPVVLTTAATEAWQTTDAPAATLEVDVPDDWTVLADVTRLRTLFENLFRNAAEHGSASPDSQAHQDAAEHGSASPPSQAQEDSEGRSPSGSRAKPDDAAEHGSASPDSQAHQDAAEHGSTNSLSHAQDDTADNALPTDTTASTVTVTVGHTDDGFYVADDGPGIPGDARDELFEYGYTTSPDGTGFGLAIVQEIAEAHGWSVSVTSSDAGGARFEFGGLSDGPTS